MLVADTEKTSRYLVISAKQGGERVMAFVCLVRYKEMSPELHCDDFVKNLVLYLFTSLLMNPRPIISMCPHRSLLRKTCIGLTEDKTPVTGCYRVRLPIWLPV